MSLADDKAAIRTLALSRRDGLATSVREAASRAVTERLLAMASDLRKGPVSVFWPIRSEIDTVPLMHALSSRGLTIVLPVVRKPVLIFRAWRPGEPLREAGFGLSEPFDDAPEVDPATMLVPLAAFDRACNRIGYGAGFYDRTIARLAQTALPRTVGLAFAVQEVARIPVAPHDRVLDAVVTEERVFSKTDRDRIDR